MNVYGELALALVTTWMAMMDQIHDLCDLLLMINGQWAYDCHNNVKIHE